MAEEAVKQRLYRAKKQIESILKKSQYNIISLSNHVFDLEAMREKEVRKIKIVLDKIDDEDIKEVKEIELPTNFTREIWCRKLNEKNFIVKTLNP